MAYDLEEQEQLDEFKAWWKKNGKLATNIALAVVIGYIAFTAYHYLQNKKAVEASVLYQTLVTTDTAKRAEINTQANALMANYSGTPYAGRAAIYAAKNSMVGKDAKVAKTQLDWAMRNAKESSIKAIASLQLAGVMYAEKNYDAALKLLSDNVDKGFSGLKEDLKGDIYLAQGKKAEAKSAYKRALEDLDSQGKLYVYTSRKLEALGA